MPSNSFIHPLLLRMNRRLDNSITRTKKQSFVTPTKGCHTIMLTKSVLAELDFDSPTVYEMKKKT